MDAQKNYEQQNFFDNSALAYLMAKQGEDNTAYYAISYWGVRSHNTPSISLSDFHELLDAGKVYFSHVDADADVYVPGQATREQVEATMHTVLAQLMAVNRQLDLYVRPGFNYLRDELVEQQAYLTARKDRLLQTLTDLSVPVCWHCGHVMQDGASIGMIDRKTFQLYSIPSWECPRCHNVVGK